MHQELDCRHLQCPMPIVKLSLAVRALPAGSTVQIEATDPAFEADLRAWSDMTGNQILGFESGATQRAKIWVA